jgi:hypothetical protein
MPKAGRSTAARRTISEPDSSLPRIDKGMSVGVPRTVHERHAAQVNPAIAVPFQALKTEIASWMRLYVEVSSELYRRSKNPLFVFQAYGIARRYPPMPEWVSNVLAETCVRLVTLQDVSGQPLSASDTWQERVALAVGFRDSRGGPTDPWKQVRRQSLAIELAIRVRLCIECEGARPGKACAIIAARARSDGLAMPDSNVDGYWRQYRAYVCSGDLSLQRNLLSIPVGIFDLTG